MEPPTLALVSGRAVGRRLGYADLATPPGHWLRASRNCHPMYALQLP